MLKMFMVAVFSLLMLSSEVALSVDMKTAEKWVCSRDGLVRTLRLYAPEKGQAPCKVFYSKRAADDPDDSKVEQDQNDGKVRPIYYSNGNGGFCVRKMDDFRKERLEHDWSCTKVI